MKRFWIAAAAAIVSLSAAPAFAGNHFSIGFYTPPPVYYAPPAPVYYAPAPVAYYPPPPRFFYPPPPVAYGAYAAPYCPRGYGYRAHYRDERRFHHWD